MHDGILFEKEKNGDDVFDLPKLSCWWYNDSTLLVCTGPLTQFSCAVRHRNMLIYV